MVPDACIDYPHIPQRYLPGRMGGIRSLESRESRQTNQVWHVTDKGRGKPAGARDGDFLPNKWPPNRRALHGETERPVQCFLSPVFRRLAESFETDRPQLTAKLPSNQAYSAQQGVVIIAINLTAWLT
jgi:hypothetical protein